MPQKPVRLAEILAEEGVESQLELSLLRKIRRAGLPEGKAQVRGIPGRQFAFDRAWPDQKVAVNVQGAIYTKGGHSTGTGIERDCEVACLATLEGWKYLPVTEKQIKSGRAVEWIAQALGMEIPDGDKDERTSDAPARRRAGDADLLPAHVRHPVRRAGRLAR